jgi:LDH2 family malate/lactate/ureidoglycolate dehydrogenase
MSEALRFRVETLERFVTDLLMGLELPETDAALVAQALVRANLEGVETHGLGRLPNYVARLRKGLVNPKPQMRLVHQNGATALLDADNGMGQVAAATAMREAIRLAETLGASWVGVRHSNHFGAASFYCNMAVEAGMIGLVFSNSPPGMVPYGGRQAYLGTNPIGIGIPSGAANPIGIDMATSAVARGHIIMASRNGQSIPLGWALDMNGVPTENPDEALRGALLPMAGAKGYALALAVETLCSALTGASLSPEIPSYFDNWEQPSNTGHMVGAINIAAFLPPEVFGERVDQLIAGLKQTPNAAGHEAVLIPGERRVREAEQRTTQGVPLAAPIVEQLNTIAAELGVALLSS